MEHQDWSTVTVRRPATKAEKARTGEVKKVTKFTGPNKQSTSVTNAAKLEREETTSAPATVSLDLSHQIQQARQAKKLKQKELATLINEKASVIQLYENGKAVPNQAILNKLSRALGVQLKKNTKKKPKN